MKIRCGFLLETVSQAWQTDRMLTESGGKIMACFTSFVIIEQMRNEQMRNEELVARDDGGQIKENDEQIKENDEQIKENDEQIKENDKTR